MSQTITQNPTLKNNDVAEDYSNSQFVNIDNQETTFGLKAAKFLTYEVINNAGVFAISVVATFLTTHGDKVADNLKQNHSGNPIAEGVAWFCAGMKQRGDWLKKQFGKINIEGEAAEMAKMVVFSFGDGCIMTFPVAFLEQHIGDIAQIIDNIAGTTSKDKSIYNIEPKELKTLLIGRAITAGIVVPTAVFLEKAGLNGVLFNTPSEWLTSVIEHFSPELIEKFGREPVKDFAKTGFFEAFYTALCTEGLRHSSQYITEHFFQKNNDASENIKMNNIKSFVRQNFSDVGDGQATYQITIENPETLILANNKLKLEKLFEANELSYQR